MSRRSIGSKGPSDLEYDDCLSPMRKILPPNSLISYKYLADEQVSMKLVTNLDLRRHNISFVPPKTKDNELETYAAHFGPLDSLGHYCSGRINEVVYLKFNNTKYNCVPGSSPRTRVMPGFYVPFSQLYSEDEDFFTKNLGLKFPETHEKALLPSGKYHRGCAFDPMFCSTFLGGNLFGAVRKSPYDYELLLQNDVNSNLEVCWFNFSVEFYEVGYYTFRIKNITKDMTRLFQRGLKINLLLHSAVFQEQRKNIGQDWATAGENIAFRRTDIPIESRPGECYYQLYFEYRCKNKHDIAVFALDVPYNPVDAERFFNNAIYTKAKGMTRIEKVEYGRTISGSPLNAYLIKKKKPGSDADQLSAQIAQALFSIKNRRSVNLTPINKLMLPDEKNQKSIVVLSRLAGSDVNSSHLMEGMVDYLLDTLDFDSLKKQVKFYFIPMANVDSVKYGTSVCNLTGSNLFNDWKNTNKIHQAEVHSLKEFLSSLNEKYPISAVISLSTQNEELFSSVVGARNDGEDTEDSRIFPYVLSKRNRLISFEHSYFYDKGSSNHMCCHLTQMFPKALAYQFNISRFELVRQPDEAQKSARVEDLELRPAGIEDYRHQGKEILSAFLEHLKLFEKNVVLKERWTREVEELEGQIKRRAPRLLSEMTAEERFTDKFWQIKPHKEPPSMTDIRGTQKLGKSEPKSNKFMELGKIYQIPFFNEIKANTPKKVPKKVASRYLRKNNESSPEHSEQQSAEKARDQSTVSNRKNLFRIEDKKSPLGKQSPLGQQLPLGKQSPLGQQLPVGQQVPSKLTSFQFGAPPPLDQQNGQKGPSGLRKELSSKMLRKVRLEEAFKERNGKSRFMSP